MNFNFRDITKVTDFGDLKDALQHNFNELLSKGYLYKGDMGETPQIVNRPLVESVDDNGNVVEWSALGKSIIGAIFKDTKYYAARGMFDINALTADGKLNGLNGATYPWWCADGNPDYPIYPATYFVYIDSTPNDIRNKDKDWEDNSCILIPADVEYSDYRNDATAEELEPEIIYHKNHIYPSFYFDSDAASAGAWCWKINDVETGIPASVANDDGSVLGHMFIFKNEDGVYKYKAGVDAVDGWMTRREMMEKELRYPITGDIGFTIEKVKETGDNPTTTETTGDDSATIANINTLQIYNFVENDGAGDNGGAWGRGGNLISFGESFYKALWKFISGDSGVDINKGKIILGTNSGNHCIFVKNKDDQTLVLMPYQDDPSEKTDFVNEDIWEEAKLQINYPETKFVNDVSINGNLNTNIITSESINNNGDISCKNITASGDISTETSISCNEITSNNLVVTDKSIIIGSNTTDTNTSVSVNILSPNFNITNTNIDTKLPFNSNNNIKLSDPETPNNNIQIHSEGTIKDVIRSLDDSGSSSKDETVTILSGGDRMLDPTTTNELSIEGALNATGASSKDHTVIAHYKSKDFTLLPNIKSISLVMPNSLGITIAVKGENKNGSWPYLSGGSIKIKIMASDGTELCSHTKTISENKGGGFGTTPEFKYCTIYCSFTSSELATASKRIIENKYAYNYIYITAEARFDLETTSGFWGQKSTIYKAGSSCKLSSCTSNSSGGSMWSSGTPANSSKNILTANITTLEPSTGVAKTSQVHICSDGILIGSAKDKAAILYIDNTGFNIKYYCPAASKVINVLSIDDHNTRTSEVFALKSEIPKSSTTS